MTSSRRCRRSGPCPSLPSSQVRQVCVGTARSPERPRSPSTSLQISCRPHIQIAGRSGTCLGREPVSQAVSPPALQQIRLCSIVRAYTAREHKQSHPSGRLLPALFLTVERARRQSLIVCALQTDLVAVFMVRRHFGAFAALDLSQKQPTRCRRRDADQRGGAGRGPGGPQQRPCRRQLFQLRAAVAAQVSALTDSAAATKSVLRRSNIGRPHWQGALYGGLQPFVPGRRVSSALSACAGAARA